MGRRDVGEVEVVAWTTPHMLEAILEPFVICGTIWPEESADASVGLVAKSSYDALAAAKDAELTELHERIYRAETNRDDWRERAEAAERQRDALREALTDVRAFLTTHISVRRHEGDSYYSQTLARVEAALKDEGSAT